MHPILIGFAARSLTRDLPDIDAHQLRDLGLTRAADGSLRLLDDPSVHAGELTRGARRGLSWRRLWVAFRRPAALLKTAL
jgi:hypothetical protein